MEESELRPLRKERLVRRVELHVGALPFRLARAPRMLTYLPATIALWLAFDLLVVLLIGAASHRAPASK